jgi:hypothetical protein
LKHSHLFILRQKPTAFVSPVDTKFIVTLDGVNPDQFEAGKESEGGSVEASGEAPKKPVPHSAPEIKPITFSLKDTDGKKFFFIKLNFMGFFPTCI